MTRDKYYMSACLALYDKVLNTTSDLIKEVNMTCDKIEKETKSDKLFNERVMNINANAYRVLSFMISENRMLRVIANITSKLPNNSVSEDVQWESIDMIDEDFFNSFETGIDIKDIKIPKVVTFEQTREPVFDLLSHMVNFTLYIILTSVDEEETAEEVLEKINNKIRMYMGVYDEMGLIIMTDSKKVKDKDLVLQFTDTDDDDDFEDDEDSDESVIFDDEGPKYLN